MTRSLRTLVLAFAVLAILGGAAYRWALANPGNLGPRELAESAARGYLFGYPLVLMDESARSGGTDVPGSAVNALRHVREFPGAGFRAVVRPNLDTLYSIAWLDLASGPLLLTLPPIPDRFYQFPVLDGWSNVVASPGSRTLEGRPGRFLIAGPGWAGEVPEGAELVAVPTRIAWLLGRIHARGEADFPVVHALQDRVRLAPTGGAAAGPWPAAAAAPDVAGGLPPDRVAALPALAFFQRLAALLADNPAAPADREALASLARLGVEPGAGPDRDAYGWLARRLLERGVEEVRTRLAAAVADAAGGPTGWRLVVDGMGRYGTDYRLRAGVALIGFGANLPEDAVYPTTDRDDNGDPLSGGRAYRLRFPPGNLPPARAFWSLTVYDGEGYLLPGVGGRHRLGSSDALLRDADGGLTLLLQPEAPAGDALANWLPLPPAGPVQLTLRLYEPGGEVLAGRWQPPAVQPAGG
ncbi:DUF1254 domain-containing protein [Pseudohaliea sp.]|uniref:DUF1254 domain-containing protein n=1 Tax=Pseudohaliea sp. TaxID=2740289 RepID=UPI0032EA96EF